MTIAKRIVLFFLLNFLIIITLSLVMNILGIRPYLEQNGINYRTLLVLSLL